MRKGIGFILLLLGVFLMSSCESNETLKNNEVDSTSPSITLTTRMLNAELGERIDLRSLIEEVTDNIDVVDDLLISYEVKFNKKTIKITDDHFNASSNGLYTVVITVTDKAGNFTTEYVTVKVSGPVSINDYLDFIINIESGRDANVLLLADTQIIDSSQMRTEDRLTQWGIENWGPDKVDELLFDHIRQVVEKSNPDLILIAGDIIYGEFDDNGSMLLRFVEHMDSYEIPWAPVFGNHDNESKMGVDWEVQQFEEAEHSLFKRGDVTGNGNYNIGITQDGKLIRVIYMLDSNGTTNSPEINENKVHTPRSFGVDQIAWMNYLMTGLENANESPVPSFAVFHIPMVQFIEAREQYSPGSHFTIGEEFPAQNGDFGSDNQPIIQTLDSPEMFDLFVKHGTDGVFVGHEHKINTSILYEGIRWTFGLKTGLYDAYTPGQVGGTLITVNEGGSTFDLEHVVYDPYYQSHQEPEVDNVIGLNKVNLKTGSPLSIITATEEKISDGTNEYYAYEYYNNTVDDTSLDRMLYLNPNIFTEDILDDANIKLVFDLYVPNNFSLIDFTNYFYLRIKAGNSTNIEMIGYNNSNINIGEWNRIEILLSDIDDYQLLGNSTTEFGLYTPSQTKIYIANIEFKN